jgi:hypothetical protein
MRRRMLPHALRCDARSRVDILLGVFVPMQALRIAQGRG